MPAKRDPLLGCGSCKTAGAWLRFAEKVYEREKLVLGQVASNAHDEALYLILRSLGYPLESEASVLKLPLKAEQKLLLKEVFRRRVQERIPAAYLTREAWLGELSFYVDERVLIPRSYFLEIVPGELRHWLADRPPLRHLVDVCTGSGCLAILLAKVFPQARVDALDLSSEALEVAKLNVHQYGLQDRLTLYQSDVFDAVPPRVYDLILSNPPYEPSRLVDRLPIEFTREPRLALDGGPDGLVIIRKLLRQAKDRLSPEGLLLIEVGGLRRAIDREFKALNPVWLPTLDGSDCVCLFQASALATWKPRSS